MSRRTIVVFHLPSNELVYLELGDLVAKPVEGDNVALEGIRYRVTDVTESIGEFKTDGSGQRRSGMDKLLELLAVRFENASLNLLGKIRNIGSGDQPEVTAGGIALPTKKLIGDFDHVVLVALKALGGAASSGILGQLHTFAAGDGDILDAAEHAASHGAPVIRVTDEAAGS